MPRVTMSNRNQHGDPEPTPFPRGKGVANLEAALRQLAEAKDWDKEVPLPTTRDLGERYRISNASVCRLLKRLGGDEIIWRRDNGRYYLNESRRLYERRKTYACLLRKLQNWSSVYQGIMSGFSEAFGRRRASLLYIHNENLVRHARTNYPPVHANAAMQRETLHEFFRDHQEQIDGILLDDVWLDEVLEEFASQLSNAVIVCRPSQLPALSSVCVDSDVFALLAIGHLYARGFDEIWLAVPFTQVAPVDIGCQAALRIAEALGHPIREENICLVASPQDRGAFIARLKQESAKRRIGIFCLEDNVSMILWRDLIAADVACPERVGIISGMGTGIVTERHLTSVQIGYEQLGLAAGKLLESGAVQAITVQPSLVSGETT